MKKKTATKEKVVRKTRKAKKVVAKVTAKRGPGRPKKIVEEPAKRGPGRPKATKKRGRKGKVKVFAKSKPTKVKAKRGPGRPKKHPGRPKKKQGPGRPKKSTTPAAVSFKTIAELAGIPVTKLRKAAKRSSFDIVVTGDSCHGVTTDKIPVLIADVKAHQIARSKLELIKADEIWFDDLRKELNLSIKQLETRCKSNNIQTICRVPTLGFDAASHYKRALSKADADKLRQLYSPLNIKEIKKIIDGSLAS